VRFDVFNPYKMLAHTDKISKILKYENEPPISVSIDPTSKCNHNCMWCSSSGYRMDNKNVSLSPDILRALCNEFKDMGIEGVYFEGGGEPLCNLSTIHAIENLKRLEIPTGLITNGVLLKKGRDMDSLLESCEFIRISIDAASAETYYHIRGANDFETVRRNVEELARRKINIKSSCEIGLSFLIYKNNYTEIEQFVRIFRDAGANYIQFKPVIMNEDWLDDRLYDYLTYHLWMVENKYASPEFRVTANIRRLREVRDRYQRLYGECLGHNLVAIIMSSGELSICCQHRGVKPLTFGNLRVNSFREIWNGKARQEAIKKINLSRCPTCKYESYNQMLWAMKYPNKHACFL